MTFSGRTVNPLDLQIEDICFEDIEHHLSLLNRFVGATQRPMSIAQHSVYVSRLVDGTGWEREALMHDATEAYLGDVSKWVKQAPDMEGYRILEDRAWLVICKVFDLRSDLPAFIKEADTLMVRYETLRLCKNPTLFERRTHPRPTATEVERVGAWAPWTWQASKRGFRDRARLIGFSV